MLHKKFNHSHKKRKDGLMKKFWQLNFLSKKIGSCERKSFMAVLKKNPRTHSPQQNKKAVLTTAAYFKASVPVRSQEQ